MKTIKGIANFIFFTVVFGSCFSPPEFSIIPSITYEDIIFKEGASLTDADSLIVYINFQDGDGDLGLSATQTDEPYHPINYYLIDGTDTVPIPTYSPYSDLPPFVKVPEGATGKLVTVRTQDQHPPLVFPEYDCPYKRTAYQFDSVFISEENQDIFDDSYNLVKVMQSNIGNPDVYVLLDTFYYKPNPFHTNIKIEFWIKNNNPAPNNFDLYDWKTELCLAQDFSQRFPILTDSENPLEGTLKYSMTSTGFMPLFSGKIMKLRIQIWDRALHPSKAIDTREFTLEQIRK